MFDPFSFIDQKFNGCCKLGDTDNFTQRLKSISINNAILGSNISLESLYGAATSPPSSNIGDVFLFLKEQHQGQLVHFLVDEFNQEFLTTSYGMALCNILKRTFNHSTVVIALQSVEKQRTICSAADNNVIQKSENTNFQSTGMKIFKLDTAVRMTRQLFNLQKNLESEVKSSPFKAAIAFKGERRAKKLYSFIIQNNNNNLPFTKLNSYFSVYNSCFE